MTVFKYKLCFILLALKPEEIWSVGRFECGEHGRFEYCIDEIPGCVVGCYCYPGFYFDTSSKKCEPNSNLLAHRRSSNPKKKSKKFKQSAYVSSAEQRVSKQLDSMASDADELSNWLYNTFFFEVEKQAEKQSKRKYNRVPKHKPRVAKFKKSYRYFRAADAEADPEVGNGADEIKPETASKSGEETKSGEIIDLDTETYSDEAMNEGEEDQSRNDSGDHDHEHILLVKNQVPKPTTASPLLPSFIFLPNLDTPYYPPLGLPVPPVMPMYPAVPVPPVAPNIPLPVPNIAELQPNLYRKDVCSECHDIIKNIILPNIRKKEKVKPTIKSTVETTITTSETTTESATTTVKTTESTVKLNFTTESSLKNTTEAKLNLTTDQISTAKTVLTTNTSMLTTETSVSTSSRNDTKTLRRSQDINDYYELLDNIHASKLFDRRKGLRNPQIKSIRSNGRIMKNGDFRDNKLWASNDFNDPLSASNLWQAILKHKANDKEPVTENIDFKYLSDLIHRPELNKINFDSFLKKYIKEYKNSLAQPHDIAYDEDLKNVYYSNLGRQIASLIRNTKNEQYEDLIIKDDIPTHFSDKNNNLSYNDYYLRNGNELLFNLENKIIATTPGLWRLQQNENTHVMEGTRQDVLKNGQENNMNLNTGNTNINNRNIHWPLQNNKNIVYVEPLDHNVNINHIRKTEDYTNGIPAWIGSHEKTRINAVTPHKPYPSNQVQNSNNPQPLPKQFFRHQQFSPKDTKDSFIFNQNPLGTDFYIKTTRRPERSYIGRTFFSGDIM